MNPTDKWEKGEFDLKLPRFMKPTCSPLEMKRGMNPTDKCEKGEFD